jgi:MATE family multidrug resistance protein
MAASLEPTSAAPLRLSKLLLLAWPVVFARMTQSFVGFSDAVMSAPLGKEPLAAVTTGAIDIFAFVILPMGVVFILQSFTAQLRGRGELGGARRYALYGVVLAFAAGAVSVAATPLIERLLAHLPYEPRVRDLLGEYLRIRLWSVAAIVGVEAFGNWYGGLGNTRVSLIAGVVTMVANIAGNYLLIEPRFGLPGYGVAGAAWASAIASWIAFGVVALFYSRGLGHDLPPGRAEFRRDEFFRVIRFGLPNGFNWFLEFGAFALFLNVVVSHLGTEVLAAFNVVIQLNSVAFMPAFGLASAGAILVGASIGAGRRDEVPPTVKLTVRTAAAWMAAVGGVYVLFPEPLFHLFVAEGEDPTALVTAGATMLGLSALWQLFDAAALTYSEALRAAGDTLWPMAARLVVAWGAFFPGAWYLVYRCDGGPVSVILSVVAYVALLSIAVVLRFRTGRWRRIELVGPETPPA